MNVSAAGAWFTGAGVIVLTHVIWFIALQFAWYTEVLVCLLWLSPFVAALVTAYLAPRRKIVLGVSMVLPTIVSSVAINLAFQLLGKDVDFPGQHGAWIVMAATFFYGAIVCALGSVSGVIFAKKINAE